MMKIALCYVVVVVIIDLSLAHSAILSESSLVIVVRSESNLVFVVRSTVPKGTKKSAKCHCQVMARCCGQVVIIPREALRKEAEKRLD